MSDMLIDLLELTGKASHTPQSSLWSSLHSRRVNKVNINTPIARNLSTTVLKNYILQNINKN